MDEEKAIDARMILEAQGAPKEKVEAALKRLIEELGKQEGSKIYETKFEPVTEKDGFFSFLVDVGMKFQDFENLISIILNFGPSALLVNEPEKLEISSREIQNVVGDITAIIHTLAQDNVMLRLQNQAMLKKLKEMGAFEDAPTGEPSGEPVGAPKEKPTQDPE